MQQCTERRTGKQLSFIRIFFIKNPDSEKYKRLDIDRVWAPFKTTGTGDDLKLVYCHHYMMVAKFTWSFVYKNKKHDDFLSPHESMRFQRVTDRADLLAKNI